MTTNANSIHSLVRHTKHGYLVDSASVSNPQMMQSLNKELHVFFKLFAFLILRRMPQFSIIDSTDTQVDNSRTYGHHE